MIVGSIPSGPWRYLFADESFADDSSLQGHSNDGTNREAIDPPCLSNEQKRHDNGRGERGRQRNKSKLLTCVQNSTPDRVDAGDRHDRRKPIEEPASLQNLFGTE